MYVDIENGDYEDETSHEALARKICLLVCLFVVIQPENPHFASRPERKVKPLKGK